MNTVRDRVIPGGWDEQPTEIAGTVLQLLMPAKPDAFIEQLEEAGNAPELADPYWSTPWPTGNTLAGCIVQHKPWPVGARIIELGCGMGYAGLGALLAGYEVLFTDYVPMAVDLVLENVRRNGLKHAHGAVLDWFQTNESTGQFRGVFATDVLYDSDKHEALLGQIRLRLAPGGECWIADPGRTAAKPFFKLAAEQFRIQLVDANFSPLVTPHVQQFQLFRMWHK